MTNSDYIIAEKSKGEEIKAYADYEERLNECNDGKLKLILEHLIKEEKEHEEMLKGWMEESGHKEKMSAIKYAVKKST
jgi:hypothetical protein